MEASTTVVSPTTATSTATSLTTPLTIPVTTSELWRPVFLYGARPLSLDLAWVEREPTSDKPEQKSHRLRFDCPNGNSSSTRRTPEEEDADNQCLRANLFPAEMSQWPVAA